MIKAIETHYAGCRFRSRLEARWAVFFDALNIKWDYEPRGYLTSRRLTLGDGEVPYLPDFWPERKVPDFLLAGMPSRTWDSRMRWRVASAYDKARKARFEHGERG